MSGDEGAAASAAKAIRANTGLPGVAGVLVRSRPTAKRAVAASRCRVARAHALRCGPVSALPTHGSTHSARTRQGLRLALPRPTPHSRGPRRSQMRRLALIALALYPLHALAEAPPAHPKVDVVFC